jgi:hypothetical protein
LLAASKLQGESGRPGMLTNGPLSGTYQVLPTLTPGLKVGKTARADVANLLLRQAEHPTLLRQYPALTR